MVDRILLITLILLLPAGIVATKLLSKNVTVGGVSTKVSAEREKKIDQLLANLSAKTNGDGSGAEAGPIEITGVVYATQSGLITLGGTVPSAKIPLEITVMARSNNKNDKVISASGSAEKMVPVQEVFGLTLTSQSFSFSKDVSDYYGSIYFMIRQGNASTTVGYDVTTNKRLVF